MEIDEKTWIDGVQRAQEGVQPEVQTKEIQ